MSCSYCDSPDLANGLIGKPGSDYKKFPTIVCPVCGEKKGNPWNPEAWQPLGG